MAVDTGTWDGAAAMARAAASDNPAAFYRSIAAGRKDGDPDLQSSWALPHHDEPGAPPNAAAVRNALSRLPQTDGLTNRDEARTHLENHLEEINVEANRSDEGSLVEMELPAGEITVRSADRREIDARLVPWDVPVETPIGLESFTRGSFSKVEPRKVVLLLGHNGDPTGRGLSLEERDDGPYMTFRVSKTQRGDELLTLARDGVTPHVSVGYRLGTTRGEAGYAGGRRVTRITQVDLDHVGTTYKPAYPTADIVAIRERAEGAPEMEQQDATAGAESPVITVTADEVDKLLQAVEKRSADATEKLLDRFEKLELRYRQDIVMPTGPAAKKATLVDWADIALRQIRGVSVQQREIQERALEDIITPDNPGSVPDAFINDLIGLVTPRRPFLSSTTQITAPATGMSITVPVLDTHSTAAQQDDEKTDIDSTAMKVTNQSFDSITIAGGADVSQQMIRRSDRGYVDLLIRDLTRAYAREADDAAVTALFTAGTTPGTGNIDPEDLEIGEAWENSMNAIEEPPDTIWMSAAGVKEFINAKNDGTNAPLYFTLNANFGAGNAPGGNVSALRPVYVPALTGTSVDIIIGPSTGFVWAEDGAWNLQVDVPSKAGRDIALVGVFFFVPRYPRAFTTYDLGS